VGDVCGPPEKVVHHRCGYALLAVVVDRFEAHEFEWCAGQETASVVVNYRDPVSRLIVFFCPGCGKWLKLWWEVGGKETEQGKVSV
jgi:hypothetical protein